MNKLLNKLDYKYGRYCIPNLMFYIVIAMAAVFIADLIFPQVSLAYNMAFNTAAIAAGQFWRVISFVFIPPNSSLIFIIFSLYFYYLIGQALESQWGSFKFNVYYFIGIIATILGGLITGFTTNTFLNYSLFFAFAVMFPDFQVNLFFFIPIKIKWLAIVDLLYFVFAFIIGSVSDRIAIVISLLNFILFFYSDFINFTKQQISYFKHRQKYKNNRYR